MLLQERPGGPVPLLVGSCNFTISSKANREAGIGPTAQEDSSVVKDWLDAFQELFDQGSGIDQFESSMSEYGTNGFYLNGSV